MANCLNASRRSLAGTATGIRRLKSAEMTDATNETLRATAFHEAGRVVVARFFGLTVAKIEIGENERGHSEIGSAEHLPLIDQIALCVAGIEAQALFNCPTLEHAAVGDYTKFRELVQELTEAEVSSIDMPVICARLKS